jgi:hypothetical protein
VLIGAILGSIFGSLLVLFLIWFCCYSPYAPRLNALNPLYRDDRSDYMDSDGYSETVVVRERRRIPPVQFAPRPARAERIIVEERREDDEGRILPVQLTSRPARAERIIVEERREDEGPHDREVRPQGMRLDDF